MRDTSEVRFRLHHELDGFYHRLFDQLADMDIKDGDAARITQLLLNSRLDALKHLVAEEEMDRYLDVYPED